MQDPQSKRVTSCCIPSCNNTSADGYLMKCFPENKIRQKLWVDSIGRSNWKPNHNHRICEAHFSANMWEKIRVDGSRKLKFNAIPDCLSPQNMVVKDIKTETDQTDLRCRPIIQIISTVQPKANCNSSKRCLENSSLKNSMANPTNAVSIDSKDKIISHPMPSTAASKEQSAMQSQVTQKTSIKSPIAPVMMSSIPSILKRQIQNANNRQPIVIPAKMQDLQSPLCPSIITVSKNDSNRILKNGPFIKFTKAAEQGNKIKSIIVRPKSDSSPPQSIDRLIEIGELDEISNICRNSLTKECDNKTPNRTNKTLRLKVDKLSESERFKKMDNLLLKQLKLNNALRNKLFSVRKKLQRISKDKQITSPFNEIFNEDQIRVLELRHTNSTGKTPWTVKTLLTAIKLKQECGTRGYEELLRLKFPFPSLRTISRWCASKNIPAP